MGDRGAPQGRQGDPRRPPLHTDVRNLRQAHPDPGRQRRRAARGADQPHPDATSCTSRSTSRRTPTRRRSCTRTSGTPRTSTGSSPATTRRRAPTRRTRGPMPAPPGPTAARRATPRETPPREASVAPTRVTSTARRSPSAQQVTSTAARGPGLEHAEVLRDETLQDPRCVMQVLQASLLALHAGDGRRHVRHQRGRLPLPGPRGHREQRAGAHDGIRLRRRLDPAHPRRTVHPHGSDHPAAPRKHGPSGRRRHGAAWAREHPGLDGHPDALQHPAGLPRHAHGRRARLVGGLHLGHRQQGAEGLLGQRRHVCREPAQGLVGQGRDGREQLGLRLPAEAQRGARHLPDDDGDARGRGRGLLPARPEPCRRVRPRSHAAPGHVAPQVARRAGLHDDRVGDLLEGRPGDRDGRAEDRGHPDRGLLPAGRGAHREERHLHPDPADAPVAPQGRLAAG